MLLLLSTLNQGRATVRYLLPVVEMNGGYDD
jgi:hypothetical protein